MIRRRGQRWQVTVYAGTDPETGRERRVARSVPAKPGQQRPPKEARELEARLLLGSTKYRGPMGKRAEDHDPVIVSIDDEEPTMTFEEWLALLAQDEPVDLGISAADLLAEARESGEV